MAEVVASIRASAADRIAGFMSMHDLAVTTTPIPTAGPIDVIWVRPQPVDAPATQDVLIEHWAPTGWDEQLVRPAPEAVSLFWRFAREKWASRPTPDRLRIGPLSSPVFSATSEYSTEAAPAECDGPREYRTRSVADENAAPHRLG
jgi:hypothetical protein